MASLPEPRARLARSGRACRGPLRAAALLAAAIVAAALVAAFVFGGRSAPFDYSSPFDRFPAGRPGTQQTAGVPDPQRNPVGFLEAVVPDIQTFWKQEFARSGRPYAPAAVVVFRRAAQSGCGPASSQTGPFYCPLDHTIYLDPGFFRQLAIEFRAPGDFADAYVVAHELGHHVQTLTGITQEVDQARAAEPSLNNALSVPLELQADCLAGVWGHSTYDRGLIDRGDLDEALRAAAAVGDDRIQQRTIGRVVPEAWTHGSSAQRRSWFLRGFEAGDPNACNTFAAS
jgi:predicted metalloprotease